MVGSNNVSGQNCCGSGNISSNRLPEHPAGVVVIAQKGENMMLVHYIEYIAVGLESIGILVVVVGVVYPLGKFLLPNKDYGYKDLRMELGKCILLGLEILVAADLVATVVTRPTMEKVLVLGVIVLIRTFLSISIQVELDGKFPWQKAAVKGDEDEEMM